MQQLPTVAPVGQRLMSPPLRSFPHFRLRSQEPLALLDLAMDVPFILKDDWGPVLDLEMLLALNFSGLPPSTSFIDKCVNTWAAIADAPAGVDVKGLSVRCTELCKCLARLPGTSAALRPLPGDKFEATLLH